METYIVAVKFGNMAPKDWLKQLQNCQGVVFLGSPKPDMARIEATKDGLREVESAVSNFCYIEEVIKHKVS